jgi:hypothetical protein
MTDFLDAPSAVRLGCAQHAPDAAPMTGPDPCHDPDDVPRLRAHADDLAFGAKSLRNQALKFLAVGLEKSSGQGLGN